MTVTYNQQAWLKERTLIHVSRLQTGSKVRLVEVDEEILSAPVIYTPTADGKLVIDVTDLVRIYGIGNELDLQIAEISSSGSVIGTVQSVFITAAGDTNDSEWIVPTHPIKEWNDNDILIGLPRMILHPILGIRPIFPILADTNIQYVYINITSVSGGWNSVQLDRAYIAIVKAGSTKFRQEMIDEYDCQKYAVVEWRDRRGMTKRAVWELRNVKENTAEKQEIEDLTNAYDVRKGKEITAVLHLDGLTAYDVWYYADIVTSSDVRVAMKASEYDSTADKIKEENKVEVTTKKAEIPDGDAGEFYSLDIEINYKRYDTV